MKMESKSAPFLTWVVCFLLLGLTGCADTPLPTWLTGEPGPDVLSAPRPVQASPWRQDKTWPNLASVPDRPDDFTPEGTRAYQVKKMKADKSQAELIRGRIEREPVPELLPLPAPGNPDDDAVTPEEGSVTP